MELSSIGGKAEVTEAMAEDIEEEHLDASQASDPRSPWGAKPASPAEKNGQARRRQ
jgi:hypothetical protein